MRSIQEFVIDNELDNVLSEDLRMLLCCLQKTNYYDFYYEINQSSEIFESLSQLDNFKELYKIFRKFFQKLPNDFEEKKYEIDVSNAKAFCDKIIVDIKHSNDGNIAVYEGISSDFKIVYLEIKLHEHRKNNYDTSLCGLILHELLHAYEDKCRKSKNKGSIFDEFTNKYKAGIENLKRKDFIIRNLAVLNYFLDKHEQRAYLSTIELDILEVIQKVKPSFEDMRTNKVLEELKITNIWKTYFNFGKFVLFIDNISDNVLEKSYYEASKTSKEKNEDINKRIKDLKQGTKNKDYKKIKSGNEIRKECKKVWSSFQKKFNSVFIKVYGEVVN